MAELDLNLKPLAVCAVPARDGHRCGSCRFLDRVSGGWRCGNFYTCMEHFVPLFARQLSLVPKNRLLAVRVDCKALDKDPCLPVNPGWFACALWLSGESMSVHAFREGHYPDYLALEALRGHVIDIELEYRTHEGSQVRYDRDDLGKLSADMKGWVSMRGLAEAAKMMVDGVQTLSTTIAMQIVPAFEGLRDLVTTNYRCWMDVVNDDEEDKSLTPT